MPKVKDIETLNTVDRFVEDLNDLFAFEKYCGSCDNFNTEDCPFRDKVLNDTRIGEEIKCNKYWN